MSAPVLDLTPLPGASTAPRRIWRQGLLETRLMLRQGEQVLLALVIPIALLVGGAMFGERFGLDRDTMVGSVLAMAVWSTAFTSTAIATGFDRRQGVLERLAATPLSRSGLIGGKIVAVVLMTGIQWVALVAVALALGWRPASGLTATAGMLVAVVLAVAGFTSLALALAGTLRAEVTLGLANLIYLVGLILGIAVAPTSLGAPWAAIVGLLPTATLGDVMRAWTSAGEVSIWALPVLAVWALAGTLLARKVFQWTA